MEQTIAQQVASMLLEVGAVKLRPEQPFVWTSGWNSPIYCDNRLTLSFPQVRKFIAQSLKQVILDKMGKVEAVAGVATAGIPQAAILAELLEIPLLYVRSSSKGHGLQNQIEGRIVEGQKVIVVEDLVSTGKSSLQAVEALQAAKFEVLGMVAIFTYGFPYAEKAFADANVPLFTLTNYDTLVSVALEKNLIANEQLASLQSWRRAPETWNI